MGEQASLWVVPDVEPSTPGGKAQLAGDRYERQVMDYLVSANRHRRVSVTRKYRFGTKKAGGPCEWDLLVREPGNRALVLIEAKYSGTSGGGTNGGGWIGMMMEAVSSVEALRSPWAVGLIVYGGSGFDVGRAWPRRYLERYPFTVRFEPNVPSTGHDLQRKVAEALGWIDSSGELP